MNQLDALKKNLISEHKVLLYPEVEDGYYQVYLYPEGLLKNHRGYPCSMLTIGLNEGEVLDECMEGIGKMVEMSM